MAQSDYHCTCGHLDSQHFCFEKAHKKPGHNCAVANTFCDGEVVDSPFSCDCQHFKLDNLSYLQHCYENKH
jgi:hypothetical protein